jgi:S1-C subfamily serine protease
MSRPCPSCGRRVPRSVAVCRCGADVPALESGATEPRTPETGGVSVPNLVVGLLLLAGVAATGYWTVTRPPAVTPIGLGPRGEAPRGGFRLVPFEGEPPTARTPEAGPAETPPPEKDPTVPAEAAAPDAPALEDVVGRVMPAVVLVEASAARGSGFYVRPDTLLTNLHVVKDDGFVKLHRVDGSTITGRVDLRAPAFDLAILRVTATANQVVIPLGTANTLRPGQEVFTIGSPFGTLRNSVTRGIVSGLRRSGAATMVQNDATSHPGNSGGPLLDRNGVAIGVTTMSERDKPGINYAVAIDHAAAILDGRVTESTAAPLALNNVKALDPAPSESQRLLDEGERAFLAAAARVARTADAMDTGWKQFRQSCYTSAIPGSFSHEWFVMLTPRSITPSQVGGGPCAAFVTGFQADANRLATTMRSALDSARRAGVLPGVVRDALRTNRLEFDGWDR